MPLPKILLLDIETSPDVVYTWRVYDANAIEVKEHWKILSFAAEWYHGKKETTVLALSDFGGFSSKSAEAKLLRKLWELLNEADIVVAHNGDKFDIRKINARFIALDFVPPSPYKTVDTKKELSRVAAFSSNKLDWISQQLELGSKLDHEGFQLWKGCMADIKKWWKLMKKYNRHDIQLMRDLYTRISPWIRQPSTALWMENTLPLRCANPACGSESLQRHGFQPAKTRSYWRYQCNDCGKWSRLASSIKGKRAEIVEVA